MAGRFYENITSSGLEAEGQVPVESYMLYKSGKWFRTIGLLVILVFGTFGNVMTLVILRRTQSTKSAAVNVYMKALALADLLHLYSGGFPQLLEFAFDYVITDLHTVLCKVMIWLSTAGGTISAWLLVAMTMQRAVSVMLPHRVETLCTRTTSISVTVSITLFLALVYSHYLYGYDLVLNGNSTSAECLMASQEYQHFIEDAFAWAELIIYSILPFVCIAVSNSVLVWTLVASVKAAKTNLATGQTANTSNREKDARSITVTVLVVSISFIILTLPGCVFYIVFYISHETSGYGDDTYSQALVYFLYCVTYTLLDLNHGINFYLYCLTGRKFRDEFKKIILQQG